MEKVLLVVADGATPFNPIQKKKTKESIVCLAEGERKYPTKQIRYGLRKYRRNGQWEACHEQGKAFTQGDIAVEELSCRGGEVSPSRIIIRDDWSSASAWEDSFRQKWSGEEDEIEKEGMIC